MAYSTLVSLENTIDQILHSDQSSISSGGKQHIISIDKYVISLKVFLEDFPEKARKLEARMRDAAMEAEDIIEWFITEKVSNCAFQCIQYWIEDLRRIKFEFQLRKVSDELDSIAREMVEIQESMRINDAKFDDSVEAISSSSHVADAEKISVVGLNEDLMEIMGWLCGNSPQLQILPITGMGGIGKTTLARNAYDAPLIIEQFDVRAWITVSQDYSEQRILSDLIDGMKGFITQISKGVNIDKAEKVYKVLVGRKFLIVMDDIWSTKVLDDVRKLFPNDNNGSRILLTTRLADVATYANSSLPSHEMNLMDADQSWNLLQKKVLEHQGIIPRELEKIGREIARSCGGLPLAVVVVAGVLSTVSKNLTSWNKIARNVKVTLSTTERKIEKILYLSYNHLPQHLRPCFLLMGGFPEDHEIRVVDLIRLWVAEGFVKQVASKSYEESAEEYMEDLIKRSLVVVSKTKSNGRMKSCSLHDLVRDLCVKLSWEERFLVHAESKLMKSTKGERRISISHSHLACFASSAIRTILFFESRLYSFGSFQLLRVLDVIRVRTLSRIIADQFFKLVHLRYLAFCYTGYIPAAISNLQSLQTLMIEGIFQFHLPYEIWNMPQLRHLIILGCCYYLLYPSDSSLALENLQTLGTVTDVILSLSFLHMVPNLKKLSAFYTSPLGDELLLHNLVHLHRLEKLTLKVDKSLVYDCSASTTLVAPTSLKKLTLIGWGCGRPYLSIVGPLPNLEVLKLRRFNFKNKEWTITDQDFPKLRFLLMYKSNLEQWNCQGSHFPMLDRLLIHSCWSLCEIPDDLGEIPTLKLIEVKNCLMSLVNQVKLIHEEQQNYGDDIFQLRCI